MLDFVKRLWSREYRYERPLSELISLSLDRETLDELVVNVTQGKPIAHIQPHSTTGIPYIEKILSEEVEKQFTEEYRPFIELIVNGIDAKAKDHKGDYTVRTTITQNTFSVEDTGKSMGLQDILQTFIIPFSTDKDKLQDLGRFGVGFFANLIYCLEKPNEAELSIETHDGKNSYKLTFWSETEHVDGLRVKVQRGTRRKQGTKVEIKGYPLDGEGLKNYVAGYMQYFDPKRAIVKVGGETINTLPPGVTYWGDETFQTEQGTTSQTVRFTVNPASYWKNQKIRMYSQGVFILEKDLRVGEFRLDFPSAIEVVEGRDEFKIDANYRTAIKKAYDLLVEYAMKYGAKDAEVQKLLRDMLPSIADELDTPFGHDQVEKLKESIFPERTYLLENADYWDDIGDYTNAIRFFGEDIHPLVYHPQTILSTKFWRGHFPGLQALVKDETEVLAEGSLYGIREYAQSQGIPFNNTQILPAHQRYSLVTLKTGRGGFSPFVFTNGTVYINPRDSFFSRPEDFVSAYGVFTTLQKSLGKEEEKIEDMILVR